MCFFFQAEDGIRDTSVTGVQTCALPISPSGRREAHPCGSSHASSFPQLPFRGSRSVLRATLLRRVRFGDRKSTRLNSSHRCISYAVFCLKKKKKKNKQIIKQIKYIEHSE